METVILILGTGLLNVLCFFIGSRIGNKVAKGENIDLPNLNPMDAIQKHKAKVQARTESEYWNAIQQNIDAYNGTEVGQKELPR